jgi:hypothetical protein
MSEQPHRVLIHVDCGDVKVFEMALLQAECEVLQKAVNAPTNRFISLHYHDIGVVRSVPVDRILHIEYSRPA